MFIFPPTADAPNPELPTMTQNDPKLYRVSLTSDAPANLPVLEHERWLLMVKDEVLMRTGGDGMSDRLLSDLEEEFQTLQRRKIEEWRRQQDGSRLQEHLKGLSSSLSRSMGCVLVETGACL